MFDIIGSRVSDWNNLRYAREYNEELAIALLKEELAEFEVDDEIERIDALCDVIFVACGVVWKLGLEICPQTINSFKAYYQHNPFNVRDTGANTIALVRQMPGSLLVATNMHALIAACFVGLSFYFDSEDYAYKAVLAICDSNDTKEVVKTTSDVKANGSSKGPNYVSPTAALNQLVKECFDVECH
ncbi:ntP-ppase-like protein [Caudoviricetes sp.]|nr:ntP-ppase-like protein [Caudoviricetes sp.]